MTPLDAIPILLLSVMIAREVVRFAAYDEPHPSSPAGQGHDGQETTR